MPVVSTSMLVFIDLQLLHYPYVDHALMFYTYSSVRPIDCRVPTIASGVFGEYNTITVNSVIIYQLVSAVRDYSISPKLSVWRRWEVESRPLPSDV